MAETSIRISSDLNERLKKLADAKSRQLGFSKKQIGVAAYLDLIATQEEQKLPKQLPQ